MQSKRAIQVVAAHAEGEVGRVIVGGVLPPPGATVRAQRQALVEDDGLRRFLIREPRGGAFTHYDLIVPATHPDADAGFIIIEPDDYPPMSGSNTICVATVLLETGMVAMQEPETHLVLEAPGGLVHVTAQCEGGRCRSVSTTNVPSFVFAEGVTAEVADIGTVTADIVYAGAFFALVDADPIGRTLTADSARQLVVDGERIKSALATACPMAHPELPEINNLSFVTWCGPVMREGKTITSRNATVISPGKIDRSPCGTASSARLALMRARGTADAGDTFESLSLLDTCFTLTLESDTTVAGRPAIIPRIAGRAWITGEHTYHLDPDDPFPEGYTLGDTWHRRV